jgi:glycosyltransferase involved in cell wall biosynthesis
MNVEVAICTWNRANLLRQTIASVTNLAIPDGCRLALIVVNNNSQDETESVVSEFNGAFGDICLIRELRQGHTICRNRAVERAQGELLLWIDDDVLVDRQWLTQYFRAAQSDPQCSFWGGPIRPVFQIERPVWIAENWAQLKGCFAERDLGALESYVTTDQLPYGANFGIRTAVQKQFLFDERLGRRGSKVFGEDELDLFRRLLANGCRGRWVADAAVDHIIPPGRANEQYVSEYFVGQGKALVAAGKPWTTNYGRLWLQFVIQRILYRCKRSFAPSPAWTAHLIRGSLAKGQYLALTQHSK